MQGMGESEMKKSWPLRKRVGRRDVVWGQKGSRAASDFGDARELTHCLIKYARHRGLQHRKSCEYDLRKHTKGISTLKNATKCSDGVGQKKTARRDHFPRRKAVRSRAHSGGAQAR